MAFEIAADVGLRFWMYTPEEFSRIAAGYRARLAREYDRTAWMICHLLGPHLKKGSRLTPEKLLGRKRRA